jgi:two-component system sensor histidine kinase RegB
LPPPAVAQALRSLVTNAQDASSPEHPVWLHLPLEAGGLVVVVRDRGCGMSESELSRAGEPFYTSKEPGRGMGLGLYLARAVVERLGGRLDIRSELQRGTSVIVTLPLGAPALKPSAASSAELEINAPPALHPHR